MTTKTITQTSTENAAAGPSESSVMFSRILTVISVQLTETKKIVALIAVIERMKKAWDRVKRAEFTSLTTFEIEMSDKHDESRVYLGKLHLTGSGWMLKELRIRFETTADASVKKLSSAPTVQARRGWSPSFITPAELRGITLSGKVDQDVDPAEPLQCPVDFALHRDRIGSIYHATEHVAVRPGELGKETRQLVGSAVGQNQMRARCCEGTSDGGAQVARGAADHDNPVG